MGAEQYTFPVVPDSIGPKIAEGKTKIIYGALERPGTVIIESNDDITKHNDRTQTQQFENKGMWSNRTNCSVSQLLRMAGIPVAYRAQLGDRHFWADQCKMIPLEVIARRFAVGSYLKRHPEMARPGNTPHRFHRLVTEFFLKTTDGALYRPGGDVLVHGLTPEQDDPLIDHPDDELWKLIHPKRPSWDAESNLGRELLAEHVLSSYTTIAELDELVRRVFLVLEAAWETMGWRLIDIKIEFGITHDGRLVVADVIDNDSWRLRNRAWKEMSKETFRQGARLADVANNYEAVAAMIQALVHKIEDEGQENQILVLWRGSEKDEFPSLVLGQHGSTTAYQEITILAHENPEKCVRTLNKLHARYPFGVILAVVGRSNGLGPMLAARTHWPVISVPATAGSFPQDVWSSLRLPSSVPGLTVLDPANALSAALNILAARDLFLKAHRQFIIEELASPN